ncbi:MAG: DoxX family protein [Gammaproteobacteria bacterium]|nr:DoxX family protein [Gammaproteobacteria bacterium]
MSGLIQALNLANARLALAGEYIAGLALRLFLAWEFGESGVTKFMGSNWFAEIQDDFPFPFNIIHTDISWFLATWSELLGMVLLVIGLGTRYISIALFILTLVAWYAVHTGYGYNVCSNGYKMALIYCVALIPLITTGPGRLSLDHWLAKRNQ